MKDVEKFLTCTLDDIVDLAEALGCPETIGQGPSIVLPDGTTYDLTNIAIAHTNFFYAIYTEKENALRDEYPEDYELSLELDDIEGDEFLTDYAEKELGVVTLNKGMTSVEPRAKIVALKRPTNAQYEVIDEFLHEVQLHKHSVALFLGPSARYVEYDFDEVSPKDVMFNIRMFFAGGRLREDASKSDDVRKIKHLYRDGQVDDWSKGLFFADSLEYYEKNPDFWSDAKPEKYEVDFSNAKIFDPMREWDLDVNSWSDIRQSREFFDSVGFEGYDEIEDFDYEDDEDDDESYHEVVTDTDYLAQYAKEKGYDVVVLRDIPSDHGYGPELTEYCVFNKNLVRKTNESLQEEMLNTEKFDVLATDNPYEVARYLRRFEDDARIFIDANARVANERTPLYLVGDVYECTHSDMIDLAKKNGYDTKFNDFDKNKLCVLYYPKSADIDYTGDVSADYYDHMYEYDDFVIFSRYGDFDDFELSKILGKHRVVPYAKIREIFH